MTVILPAMGQYNGLHVLRDAFNLQTVIISLQSPDKSEQTKSRSQLDLEVIYEMTFLHSHESLSVDEMLFEQRALQREPGRIDKISHLLWGPRQGVVTGEACFLRYFTQSLVDRQSTCGEHACALKSFASGFAVWLVSWQAFVT
jgi:hypothetical protein